MVFPQWLVVNAPVLSASAALLSLGFAWIVFALRQRHNLKNRKDLKASLIKAIQAELENVRPWAADPYDEKHDYWKDPNTQDWKYPLAKLVYPFTHENIRIGATQGIDRGFGKELVTRLIELEQAILVFEQALNLCIGVRSNYPAESLELTQHWPKNNSEPPSLRIKKLALIALTFDYWHYLHVTCIGKYTDDRNLHSSFHRAQKSLNDELSSLNDDKQWKLPRWYLIPDAFSGLFIAFGFTPFVWLLIVSLRNIATPFLERGGHSMDYNAGIASLVLVTLTIVANFYWQEIRAYGDLRTKAKRKKDEAAVKKISKIIRAAAWLFRIATFFAFAAFLAVLVSLLGFHEAAKYILFFPVGLGTLAFLYFAVTPRYFVPPNPHDVFDDSEA